MRDDEHQEKRRESVEADRGRASKGPPPLATVDAWQDASQSPPNNVVNPASSQAIQCFPFDCHDCLHMSIPPMEAWEGESTEHGTAYGDRPALAYEKCHYSEASTISLTGRYTDSREYLPYLDCSIGSGSHQDVDVGGPCGLLRVVFTFCVARSRD